MDIKTVSCYKLKIFVTIKILLCPTPSNISEHNAELILQNSPPFNFLNYFFISPVKMNFLGLEMIAVSQTQIFHKYFCRHTEISLG